MALSNKQSNFFSFRCVPLTITKQSTKRIIQTTRTKIQQKLKTTKLGNLESELLETNRNRKYLKKRKMQQKERLGFRERKESALRGGFVGVVAVFDFEERALQVGAR